MKIKNVETQHTIIFFDIRNFSEHRWRLAENRRAKLLTKFVREILDKTVELLEDRKGEFGMSPPPTLSHTGDGFMLILRGDRNPLLGLLWMSEFRRFVTLRLKAYEQIISGIFEKDPPKKLGFGIGAHYGKAVPFDFKSFGSSSKTVGFIGSALNIAARVEQCTKDHVHQVIFTGALRDRVLKIIPPADQKKFEKFWTLLGQHRLRGFEKPRWLYGFKPGFHIAWKAAASTFPGRFS